MRALVLLLLVAASFFLVVEFYPSSQVEGAEESSVAPGGSPAEAGFLTREGDRAPAAEGNAPLKAARTAAVERPMAVVEAPEEKGAGGWLSAVEPPAPKVRGEIPVAAALAHGRTEDVRRALAAVPDFPASRAGLAEAFALAYEGDPRAGLGIAAGLDESELTAREKALLQDALGGTKQATLEVRARRAESPLVLAMEMLLEGRQASQFLDQGESAQAAHAFSQLILAELDAPWPASEELLKGWSASLDRAQSRHRWHPKGGWPAEDMVVEPGDNAIAIRKRYLAEHPSRLMCSGLILAANAVRGYLQPGQVLRIPVDQVRIMIDLSARWAVYLIGDEVGGSWPVGIGREGEATPPGQYQVLNKVTEPSWMRIGKDPIPYGDPRNPLGTRWLGWAMEGIKTSYGFHGTKDPASVGKPSSDGCIRFRNEDVERLFEILPEGAPILVRP